MEHKNNQKDRANEYFKKELSQEDITKAAHYTYRDGFRLGLGIFVGFLLGSIVLTVIIYLLNFVLRVL